MGLGFSGFRGVGFRVRVGVDFIYRGLGELELDFGIYCLYGALMVSSRVRVYLRIHIWASRNNLTNSSGFCIHSFHRGLFQAMLNQVSYHDVPKLTTVPT